MAEATNAPRSPAAAPQPPDQGRRFRMVTHVGGHPKGAVINESELRHIGADPDDHLRIGSIEQTNDPVSRFVDSQLSFNDAATKGMIEREIRDRSTPDRPLSMAEQQKIVTRITQEQAARLAEREAQAAAPPPPGRGPTGTIAAPATATQVRPVPAPPPGRTPAQPQ